MYALRFPGEDVGHLTMQQLRGREGARVRASYRAHANRSGVEWPARRYDPQDWSAGDPVNRALSAANACLYGAVNAAVIALGCSPGLGFVHTGHARAFVYDIADLYKSEITIPAAFDVAAAGPDDVGGRARRHVRDRIYDSHLIDRAVGDIHRLLFGQTTEQATEDTDLVSLWDDAIGIVPGGTAYTSEP
jgi:CRISPR-associated protein Cas1